MDPHSINYRLMSVKSGGMDALRRRVNNQAMLENKEGFAERFDRLRYGMSYQALSDAVFRKSGIRITPQGMHRWVKAGSDISEENLAVIAEFFGVRPAWLRYGEGPESDGAKLQDIVKSLPGDAAQEVLDFFRYKIERADGMIASEQSASYLAMIDRLKEDMKKRKRGDN